MRSITNASIRASESRRTFTSSDRKQWGEGRICPEEKNPETLCILKAQRKFHRPETYLQPCYLKWAAGHTTLSLEFSLHAVHAQREYQLMKRPLHDIPGRNALWKHPTFQQTSGRGQHPHSARTSDLYGGI